MHSSGSGSGSHNSSTTGEFGLGGDGDGSGSASSGSSVAPARLVTDRVLSAPAHTMVLFPSSGGNIHAFTAISPCAILDVLTPPYGNRNCTYYREVFPPQWVDEAGTPVLVPSEDVASWVAWQAAGQAQQQQQQRSQGPDTQPAAAGQQQQQQPAVSMDCTSSSSSGDSHDHHSSPVLQYPSAVGEGDGGREDIIVGLEVWREPADFHVARGTYTGARVDTRQHSRA
jgi:hypothetical protein